MICMLDLDKQKLHRLAGPAVTETEQFIRFKCPVCGAMLKSAPGGRRRTHPCPSCQQYIVVPQSVGEQGPPASVEIQVADRTEVPHLA
jgi:hypothetical protein